MNEEAYEILHMIPTSSREMVIVPLKQWNELNTRLQESQEVKEKQHKHLQLAHIAISKIAGYAPIGLVERIETQLQRKL